MKPVITICGIGLMAIWPEWAAQILIAIAAQFLTEAAMNEVRKLPSVLYELAIPRKLELVPCSLRS